jgi:hypothetical protein
MKLPKSQQFQCMPRQMTIANVRNRSLVGMCQGMQMRQGVATYYDMSEEEYSLLVLCRCF